MNLRPHPLSLVYEEKRCNLITDYIIKDDFLSSSHLHHMRDKVKNDCEKNQFRKAMNL